MKSIIILMTVLLSTSVFAGSVRDLNRGLVKGYVKLKDVKVNNWLEIIQDDLDMEHDFSENSSYVFEDIEDIVSDCEFAVNDDTDIYEQISANDAYHVDWKKAVKRKKSVAYIAYLVVTVTGPSKFGGMRDCDVIRGSYAINRKGKEITDSLDVDLEKFFY